MSLKDGGFTCNNYGMPSLFIDRKLHHLYRFTYHRGIHIHRDAKQSFRTTILYVGYFYLRSIAMPYFHSEAESSLCTIDSRIFKKNRNMKTFLIAS